MAVEIKVEVSHSPYNYQCLQFRDAVVGFWPRQGTAGISHRMDQSIILHLGEHSPDALDAGICFKYEVLVKLGVC